MPDFDLVIPPMFYVGAYALFTLIFTLLGVFFARKYKWQYTLTKIGTAILAAALSVLLLNLTMPALAGSLMGFAEWIFEKASITDLLRSENVYSFVRGLFSVVCSFLLFMPVFFIVKAILNCISKRVWGKILTCASEKKEALNADVPAEALCEEETEAAEEAENFVYKEVTKASEYEMPDESNGEITSEETEQTSDPRRNNGDADEKVIITAGSHVPTYASVTASDDLSHVSVSEKVTVRADRCSPWSLLCGAVSGFLAYTFVIAPLVCFLSDVGKIASDVLSGVGFGIGETVIAENIDSACENVGVDIISYSGGRLVYNGLFSFEVGGERVVLGDELELADYVVNLVCALSDKSVSAHEKSIVIDKVAESFGNSHLIPLLAADVISDASGAWLEGEKYLNSEKPHLGNNIDESVIDEVLTMFSQATPETLEQDVLTVCRILSAAVDNGILDIVDAGDEEDDSRILVFLENEECTKEIIEALLENERLSPLVTLLANVGVEEIAAALNLPESDEDMYYNFIDDVSQGSCAIFAQTQAERVILISDVIKKAYDRAGIELPAGAEYTVAAYIVAHFDGQPSTDDVKSIFENKNGELDTYEKLLKGVISFDSEQGAVDYAVGIFKEIGITEGDVDSLALRTVNKAKKAKHDTYELSVKSPEDIAKRSVRVTLEDVQIGNVVISDVSKEAQTLAKAISKIASLAPELSEKDSGDDGDNTKEEMEKLLSILGELLDTLCESEYLKDGVITNTVTGALQSDPIRKTLGITSHGALSLSQNVANGVRNGDSYSKHLAAIGKTVNVLSSKDELESKENVKELIQNVTPSTAGTLKELVSEEVLSKNGVPEDKSEAVADIFSSMFDEMAKINETSSDSAYVEKEAEAVSKAIEIATSDSEKFKGGVFGTEQEAEAKIEEYTDLITGSDIMKDVLIDTVYGEKDTPTVDPLGFGQSLPEHERVLVVEKLDTLYKEEKASGSGASDMKEYEKLVVSIAAFLNIDVNVTSSGVTAK